jgi:hypothetical protein
MARSAPKRGSAQRDKARDKVRERLDQGKPVNARKLAEEHPDIGSHYIFEVASALEDQARAKDDAQVASVKFNKAQQEHIDAAKRQSERRVKAAFAARMHQIDEEVRQRVLKDGKAYLARLEQMEKEAFEKMQHYETLIDRHRAIFTVEQFKMIVMSLHPDNSASAETRAEGFRLFNAKKLQLTKQS